MNRRRVLNWSKKMASLWTDIQLARAYWLNRRGIRGSLSPQQMRRKVAQMKKRAA